MEKANHSGFLLINKPSGPTSHDIINSLRQITGQKKIGHAGTLDPLASGLLICAVGREATREIDRFVKQDKVYEAEIVLGQTTDSYDRLGKTIATYQGAPIIREAIEEALKKFIGEQKQIPPMFSAKKINGQKLYELARRGESVERPASLINIFEIKIIAYAWPRLTLSVHCSSGTYIRSLAHDLGQILGTGAHLAELKRTRIGEYDLSEALAIKSLTADNWQTYFKQQTANNK